MSKFRIVQVLWRKWDGGLAEVLQQKFSSRDFEFTLPFFHFFEKQVFFSDWKNISRFWMFTDFLKKFQSWWLLSWSIKKSNLINILLHVLLPTWVTYYERLSEVRLIYMVKWGVVDKFQDNISSGEKRQLFKPVISSSRDIKSERIKKLQRGNKVLE